jgi:hypothetical protein
MKQNKHRTRDIVLFAETRDRNQTGDAICPPIYGHCATYICASVCFKVFEKPAGLYGTLLGDWIPVPQEDLVYPPNLMMSQTLTKSPTLETED